MAELTIDAADIAAVLRKNVEGFRPEVDRAQVGRVLEVGDGIARVAGLPHASVNELLEFEGGSQGLALNLEEDTIGAVILAFVSWWTLPRLTPLPPVTGEVNFNRVRSIVGNRCIACHSPAPTFPGRRTTAGR